MPERFPPILPPVPGTPDGPHDPGILPTPWGKIPLPRMGPPVYGIPKGKEDFSWLTEFLDAWREDLPVFLVLVGLFFLGVWGALGGASSPVEVVAARVSKGLT